VGVIYIGDRETGKTSLAMELAHPNGNYVKVISPDYEYLKGFTNFFRLDRYPW